jgi:hypothetical protein
MSIQQISVFLENRQGSLEAFCALLGEHGIDLTALSIADTTDFGILRAIVSDSEQTLKLVRQAGYTANLTDVLAVAVPDTPGGLAGVLHCLGQGGVSIEYLYSLVRRVDHMAIIVFKVDQPQRAAELLGAQGLRLLAREEVSPGDGERLT